MSMPLYDFVSNGLKGASPPAEPADIQKVRRFIHENYTDSISLAGAARAANLNAGHLSEKFKQVTGINFVKYVGRLRVERACERLRDTTDPISHIAFEVGFQSLSQFNRVFRKLSGKSPTEYRMGSRPPHNGTVLSPN
jgi:AraC-like DNA-binding protein